MADQCVLTNGMNFKDILSNYCITCTLGSTAYYFNFFPSSQTHCCRKSSNILSRSYSVDGFSSTCFVAIWRYMYMYATLFNSYNHKFSLTLGVLDTKTSRITSLSTDASFPSEIKSRMRCGCENTWDEKHFNNYALCELYIFTLPKP